MFFTYDNNFLNNYGKFQDISTDKRMLQANYDTDVRLPSFESSMIVYLF